MNWIYRSRLAGVTLALAAGVPSAALAYANPTWTQPQTPFRIVGDVYYVGSKGLAAYLIASPKGHILIDGTLAENAPMIEANIKRLGFRLHDVKVLLSGHAHYDHAGALAELKRDTGAQLLAAPGDVWALEHGRPRGDSTGVQTFWPPAKVDRPLRDREVIQFGSVALTTLFTPGHTPGCTSWTLPVNVDGEKLEVVFLCSLTVAGNVLVGNKAYPGIASDYRKSFTRLDAVANDIVLPEHPELTDVLGRHESEMHGDKHAWEDSGQLLHLVEEDAAVEYDTALGRPPRPNMSPAAPSSTDGQPGWRTVVHADSRFSIDFPEAPTVADGRRDFGGIGVSARTYAAERDTVTYRLTVVDLSGRPIDREVVIRGAVDRMARSGVTRTYVEARVRTAYGRQISVERSGGAWEVGSVFLAGDRLFELEAIAPGSLAPGAGAAMVHFQQSLDIWR